MPHHPNGLPPYEANREIPPMIAPSSGGFKRKKRSHLESHHPANKRLQKSTPHAITHQAASSSYHPAGIPIPGVIQYAGEVISLLDDDAQPTDAVFGLSPSPSQARQTSPRSSVTGFAEHAHAVSVTEPKGFNDPSADGVPITEPELVPEQARLVDLILSGRNVFYTGAAGSGKSTVLKAFVKRLPNWKKVNVIAPTGRAALDINGSTTWTYAGWTPDSHKKPLEELKRAAEWGKFNRTRLRATDVLVIDEISMVENLHFERLNAVLKAARGDGRPFGGVQLIVTGDFCQLPPVQPFKHCIECGRDLEKNREGTEYRCKMHGTYYDIDKWAFRSQAWKECNFEHVNLTHIHRQTDKDFIHILNKLRLGMPLQTTEVNLLLNHESETDNAIKLFATREEVKRVNDRMFNKLNTEPLTFRCLDHFKCVHNRLNSKGTRDYDGTIRALKEHRYESLIQLKEGMLVVLLHNLDISEGLVNGSQGIIEGFEKYDKAKMPKSSKRNNRDLDVYAPGVPILGGDHGNYREWQLNEYIKQAKVKAWPIVSFLNGVTRTIYADCTVNELGDTAPYSLLSRTQIPLMAAWAMTTHKSQGMTLNRVVVDLSRSFEQGQAYVALSRVRSLGGLKVEGFPKSAQSSGNEQVREFFREKLCVA